jgi:hypothetical protein
MLLFKGISRVKGLELDRAFFFSTILPSIQDIAWLS